MPAVAAWYRDNVAPPIPLEPRSKKPEYTGWQERVFEPELFRPDSNIGVRTGNKIIDADCDHPAAAALASVLLPATGSKWGRASKPHSHFVFRIEPWEPFAWETFKDPRTGEMWLELRGDGLQTMVPPSVHPSGEELEGEGNGVPGVIEFAELESIARVIAIGTLLTCRWPGLSGSHNDLSLWSAAVLAGSKVPEERAVAMMTEICRLVGDHEPVARVRNVRETYRKVEDGIAVKGISGLRELLGSLDSEAIRKWFDIKVPLSEICSDHANGLRVAEKCEPCIRTGAALGVLKYEDGRWQRASGKLPVMQIARDTLQNLGAEFARMSDGDERKAKALRWAATSLNYPRIGAAAELALLDARLQADPAQFDRDPYAFNVRNGTLNLRTGGITPHERGEWHTKISPVAFDPRARAPLWSRFIDEVTDGDTELAAFIQRAVGYSLTGEVTEQALFFLYGTGSNGKSTLVETLSILFGDYALKVPSSALMRREGDSIPSDIADLPGVRFAVSNELSAGKRLDEATVKDLTGADTITARHLFRPWFRFSPSHKLWIYGNHKPLIRGTDHGIWRRIRLIPFERQFPVSGPGSRGDLRAELRTELPGILNWSLEGCLAWQMHGLGEPRAVASATEGYRHEQDSFGLFLESSTVSESGAKVKFSELYGTYSRWASENGEYTVSAKFFGQELERRGYPDWRSNGVRFRKGIRLIAAQYSEPAMPFPLRETS